MWDKPRAMQEQDPAIAIILSAWRLTQIVRNEQRDSEILGVEIDRHLELVRQAVADMVGVAWYRDELEPVIADLIDQITLERKTKCPGKPSATG